MSARVLASGPLDPDFRAVVEPGNDAVGRGRGPRGAFSGGAPRPSVGNSGIRRGRSVGLQRVASGVPRSAARGPSVGADPVPRGPGGGLRSGHPRLDPEIVGRGVVMGGRDGAWSGARVTRTPPMKFSGFCRTDQIDDRCASKRSTTPGIGSRILVRGPSTPSPGTVARMVLSRLASPMRDRRNETCSEA